MFIPPPELKRNESVGLSVPSNEIKLLVLDVVDAVPREKHTTQPQEGEVCIPGPSVLNAINVHHSFPIFTSPRNIVALSRTSPTSPALAAQSEFTQELNIMILYHRPGL